MGGRMRARPTGRAIARREEAAIELANAQMFQALRFSELVREDDVSAVYRALLAKAKGGNLQAIRMFLDRVIGPEVVQIERTEVDVAGILALAMGAQQDDEAEVIDVIAE